MTGTNVMPELAHAIAISNHSLRLPLTMEIVSPAASPAARKLCTNRLTR